MATYFVMFLDPADTPKGDDALPLAEARRGGGGVVTGYVIRPPNLATFDGWLNALPPDVTVAMQREQVRLVETEERARLLIVLDAGRTQRIHNRLWGLEGAPSGQ